MANPSLSAIAYTPGPVPSPPSDAKGLLQWARDMARYQREEFEKIAAAVQLLATGHVETTNVAPAKPREGDFRLSDGTNWNPVAAGAPRFVGYRGGAWVLLG